jgi:hypothetical protein
MQLQRYWKKGNSVFQIGGGNKCFVQIAGLIARLMTSIVINVELISLRRQQAL